MAKAKLPYMKLWVGDWLSSSRIQELEPEAEYILFRLCLWSWQANGNGLANKDEMLARYARVSELTWEEHKASILPLFEERDGRLYHPKVEEQRQSQQRLSEIRAAAGMKGGTKKKAESKGKQKGSTRLEDEDDYEDDSSTVRWLSAFRVFWNEKIAPLLDAPKLKRPETWNPTRVKKLKKRYAENPKLFKHIEEASLEVSQWAKDQTFLCIDWLLNPANLSKFLEGNYSEKKGGDSDFEKRFEETQKRLKEKG